MKNLNILVIAPQPFVEVRGTPLANLRLTQILADAGHEVTVLTYPFGADPTHPGIHVHRCRSLPIIRSVKIGFSPAKLLLDVNLFLAGFSLMRRRSFDCLHGVEEGGVIALLLSRMFGIPYLYDMDSVLSHEIAGCILGKIPAMVPLTRALETAVVRSSIAVVTISESMAEHVKSRFPSKAAFVVPDVPLPWPEGGTSPDRALSQIPPEYSGRRLVTYTGSLASYQGLDLLLQAMAKVKLQVPDVLLVIVGGSAKDTQRLAKRAKAVGLIHHLLLMGKRPPEQVPDFLDAADLLVSPRRGGINPPAKIYTYMQSGKPIVATDIPAHTTVLDATSAILVPPTARGLADGILWALNHPEEARAKGSRAKEIVSTITPELQAVRVREAYRYVAALMQSRRQQ